MSEELSNIRQILEGYGVNIGNVTDDNIIDVVMHYALRRDEYIRDICSVVEADIPDWLQIDVDRTLRDMEHWGFEFIEVFNSILPIESLKLVEEELRMVEFVNGGV